VILVKGSHFIHFEHPELVAATIERVVSTARE
jgi:hypothetical protein